MRPESFVAIEIQTIDTTNSYASLAKAFYDTKSPLDPYSKAGFNWENVSKRILPQIIYKGHAIRREELADKGMFFILPSAVFERIKTRVGGKLLEYPMGPGTVTFQPYSLGPSKKKKARQLKLEKEKSLTTTVEQLAFAFVSPQNLPPLGTYENTIDQRLRKP